MFYLKYTLLFKHIPTWVKQDGKWFTRSNYANKYIEKCLYFLKNRLKLLSSSFTVNARPTGTADFPPATGGGGGDVWTLSRLLTIGRREKQKKKFESSSKVITKLFQQISRLCKNCGIQGPKMTSFYSKWQVWQWVFSDCQISFRKPPLSREVGIIAKANPKTAFESELNSTSLKCRQIWHMVNGLACRGHRSQKRCYWD